MTDCDDAQLHRSGVRNLLFRPPRGVSRTAVPRAPRGCNTRALRLHDVNDDVARVDQHPFAGLLALDPDDRRADLLQPLAHVIGERLHLPIGLGGGDDHRVVQAGELAHIENGDVARFDVFESGDGGFLDLVKSHPDVIDRVGCGQYRPKRRREANRAPRRFLRLRARAPRVSPTRNRVRGDRLDDDRSGRLGGERGRIVAKPPGPFRCERGCQRGIERNAGTCDDDDMSKIEYFPPAMPGRKPEKRIGAHDERKCARRLFGAQLFERFDRVAASSPLDLSRVDFETWMIGDRELDHGQAMDRGRDRCSAMRRIAGRNEADREIQCSAQLARQLEVPAMYRIEGAAENAENGMHACNHCSPGAPFQLPETFSGGRACVLSRVSNNGVAHACRAGRAARTSIRAPAGRRFPRASMRVRGSHCGADSGRSGE
jgi:hypothetical protein